MPPPRLTIQALEKSFGANRVLRRLDLTIAPGEIHALVGGNGAGKSTLSKIIAGIATADAGELRLDGAPYRPATRLAATAAGVVMVLQELNVLPTLSVAENLFLSNLPRRGGVIVNRRELQSRARLALGRVGLTHLDPDTPAAALGIGHQQLVEIAAGLAQSCRLLILDEPTAALTQGEIETLFRLLAELRAHGTSVLYISHRLNELAGLADRVSVLRDGQLVAMLPIADTTHDRLIELMSGTKTAPAARAAVGSAAGQLALQLRSVRIGTAVRDVSLELHSGEILGLGGLVGAGRTELLRVIYGADRRDGGEMFLGADRRPFAPRSPADAVAAGFAFVPEDRKQHGILAPRSVRENANLARLASRHLWLRAVDGTAEAAATSRVVDSLAVRCTSAEQPIAELSGGNQQKLVVGRWLGREVRIWLLDEPTRGVDVDARRRIYALLAERAAAGEAILVASSDYEELATLCHRVLVMSNGGITAEFAAADLRPDTFMAAAFRGFASTTAA
ncbi:MAG TPA: sugar ABC transporter ATP-binding protein [Opitutus sp.]|nr:sugar ABC transporter ATP-binding protein [Opitutus sp.]